MANMRILKHKLRIDKEQLCFFYKGYEFLDLKSISGDIYLYTVEDEGKELVPVRIVMKKVGYEFEPIDIVGGKFVGVSVVDDVEYFLFMKDF